MKQAIIRFFRSRPITSAVVGASLLAVLYWGVIASDLYVSEAHIIIIRTDSYSSGSTPGTTLLGTPNVSGGATDFLAWQLWLRDYMYSVDMLEKLDAKLDLRSHYSDWHRDPLSRMWFKNWEIERFQNYFLNRVDVELDSNSGTLVIKVQAYDAKMAHAIASMLVEEGERYFNEKSQQVLADQVAFIDTQVGLLKNEDEKAHQILVDFQNKTGLVSPVSTIANMDAVVSSLDGQKVALQASRTAMLAYLMPNNPSILALDQQIAGLEKQISTERARMASGDYKKLDSLADQAVRLQTNVAIMDTVYASAFGALQTEKMMAALMMKKIFVVQSPLMPQYPQAPRKIYNVTVFILAMLMLAGIVNLMIAIIRDHKD